jgi:dTDP-4-amino-4,6-dideoxygalactose transaminase
MWEYDIIGPWYKCNMTDIMASLGLVQMRRYPKMLDRLPHIPKCSHAEGLIQVGGCASFSTSSKVYSNIN